MSRQLRAHWLSLPALVLVIAGCGTDDGAPPEATAPLELVECVDPGNPADESACLDQIERFIESDIAGIDDAIERVTDVLSRVSSPSYDFERVTPVEDGYNPAEPGDAIELQWRVGTTDRTMFVCATGDSTEVGPDPCPG